MEREIKCPKTSWFFPLDGDPSIEIIICIFNSLTSATATVANLLVIISIWRTPSLHTPSNVLVVGLAFSDFCIGLVAQPIFVASSIFKIKRVQEMYCPIALARAIPGFCLSNVTLITLTLISLDRYIGIKLHLRYREIVTIKRVIAVLVSVWLAHIVISLSILWSDTTFVGHFTNTNICLSLTVTSVTYFLIYRVVRRHKEQIRAQLQVQQWQRGGVSANTAQLNKSSRSMFLITFTFVLCCLPILFISSLPKSTDSGVRRTLHEVQYLVVLINSTINPLLFCWRFKQIRLAVLQTVKRIIRRSSNE